MAEQGSWSRGKYGGKAATLLGEARVTYGVHATVEAMQTSCGNRSSYRIPRIPQRTDQLSNRDDAVLVSGKASKCLMGVRLPFVAHTAIKGNGGPISPPLWFPGPAPRSPVARTFPLRPAAAD